MERQVILFAFIISPVLAFATLHQFSCNDLPFQIPLNRSCHHELSIGTKSLAIVTPSLLMAEFPFAAKGNDSLSVVECVGFDWKAVCLYETGAEEERVHYRCLPCKSPEPDIINPTSTTDERPLKVAFVGVVLLVLAGLLGGVWAKKPREVQNEMV